MRRTQNGRDPFEVSRSLFRDLGIYIYAKGTASSWNALRDGAGQGGVRSSLCSLWPLWFPESLVAAMPRMAELFPRPVDYRSASESVPVPMKSSARSPVLGTYNVTHRSPPWYRAMVPRSTPTTFHPGRSRR